MDDIIQDFLVESFEGLDQLDEDLVDLEQDPSNKDCIPSIFRTIHTIKGTCGFLGFSNLESLTHIGENLLSKLREGKVEVTEPIITALLRFGDATREIMQTIAETEEEGNHDVSELIEVLRALNDGAEAPAPVEPDQSPQASAQEESVPNKSETPQPKQEEKPPAEEKAEGQESQQASSDEATAGEPAANDEKAADAPSQSEKSDETVKAQVVVEETPKSDKKSSKPKIGKSPVNQSIRVDVELLDSLMNLVGELVLARNQILQVDTSDSDSIMSNASQRLNLITSELQESVMKTRMQAIGTVCNKFPRVVRDLSLSCNKKARILIEGSETEVDRTIIEAIKDPLTHIIRNSVDHGIESPEERLLAGKDEEGLVVLRAFHEGGQVNIEIKDDGAGLDSEALKKKARALDLMDAAKLDRVSDGELFKLIFHPGFSTAKKVTNVSGRGVGMDVVKTNIEKIGGTIDIASTRGVGTTFRIKIPLTLAIIPALMIGEADHCFAIPQASLLELVRLDSNSAANTIEKVHSTPVYRLRGELLPLVFLDEQLGLADGDRPDVINIVVLKSEDTLFGLVVGEVRDSIEIVVKPLSKQLSGMPHYAGATILGDGQVALILDVTGLARIAGLLGEVGEAIAATKKIIDSEDSRGPAVPVLVVETGCSAPLAMELREVARIEETRKSNIEMTGNQEVLQYRGGIMPLFKVADAIGCSFGNWEEGEEESETVYVIVYEVGEKSIGLVVERIVDVLDVRIELDEGSKRQGVRGAIVIDDTITELLDLDEIVGMLAPSLLDSKPQLCEV